MTTAGRTLSYADLAAMIDDRRAGWPAAGRTPVVADEPDVADRLATVLAAAADGRAVVVDDPQFPAPEPVAVPAGTFLIAVTSGTSGTPRPVLRTQQSWTASFAPLAQLAGLSAADRVLLTGPLHATLHLFAAVHTLALGAELTDLAGQATAVHAVPAALAALLRDLPETAPLRVAVIAGAALPDDVAAAAHERGITVVEYYGAAELSFVGTRRWPGPLQAFPGAEVQIRPDAPGRPGRIWVRSPYLATGYPPGTTGPLERDPAGFATVGDLGESLPGDGFRVLGRGDAAVTTGGHTVLAEDIEGVLGALPGVAAVAVVGVPHGALGEVVTAVIEPEPGADLSGLRAAARQKLRGPSLPRRWLIAGDLPRTPGGKVRRGLVAEAARGEHTGLRPLP